MKDKKSIPHNMVNMGGRLLDLSSPVVMGILNATPDSFYAGCRVEAEEDIAARADRIMAEGAKIIDVGACSTRPGSEFADKQEEMTRLRRALRIVRKVQPEALVSVDTFRPEVARMAVEEFGVGMVNDISGGGFSLDAPETIPPMFECTARLRVPYVLTSVESNLHAMLKTWAGATRMLHSLGVADVILDPGFGFGKDLTQNYQLMARLDLMRVLQLPILVGVSRKSMIWKLLDGSPQTALAGTTALHAMALSKGASILRVHDVAEAVDVCKVMEKLLQSAED